MTIRALAVSEAELDSAVRAQAAALLSAEWGDDWRERAYAGEHPPRFRVIETVGGDLAGHVSAFLIPTRPRSCLFGIGDLVVRSDLRGRGIARRICATVVSECLRNAAEIVLVDTVDAAQIFLALGFQSVRGFQFFYERDGACHRHRHWLYHARAPLGRRIELLENGDF